ncbi:MAG TPA: flagellar FlbD family protein [Planctomycetota bacterium]|nr:flagellar FlbD family protein [Planctomycetota bacterium]
MIDVTRLDGRRMVINADLIKYVESTPDTIVTLTTGEKILVKQSARQVVERVIDYGRRLRVYPEAS